MLQAIRDRIQGWIAGFLIFIIAGAFVIWGLDYFLQQTQGAKAKVAKVNGEAITAEQLSTALQRLTRQQQAALKNQPMTEAMRKQLRGYALQNLVMQTAMWQSAHDAGFTISQSQVQEILTQAPEFQVRGRFSPQRFQQFLYTTNMSPEQLLSQLQTTLVTSQLANGVSGTAFVLPSELQNAYTFLQQKRDIGYFLISSQRFLAKTNITPEQIKTFYENNKDHFMTPEKVKVSYIMLDPKELKKKVSISTDQLKNYYQTHQANFTLPKRWLVTHIRLSLSDDATDTQVNDKREQLQKIVKQLQRGVNFKKLAMTLKNTKVQKKWISQDQAKGNMAYILKQLKPGQVSSIFRDKKGINVVRLIKIAPGRTKSFAEVRQTIRQSLTDQAIQKLLSERSELLSDLTYSNPTTLKVAADKLGLKIHTSPFITRLGSKQGILANPKVLAALFSDDVLQQGNNSNPIEIKDSALVVIRVAERRPQRLQPLKDLQAKIKARLLKEKIQKRAGFLAYRVEKALANGETISHVAKQFGLKWTSKPGVKRDNKAVPSPIVSLAFALPFTAGQKTVSVNTAALKGGDFAVVKINNVHNPSVKNLNPKKLQRLNIDLLRLYSQIEYRLYVKHVMDAAKVKIYKENS